MAKAYVIPDLLSLLAAAQAYPKGAVGFQQSSLLTCTRCIANEPHVFRIIQGDLSFRARKGMPTQMLLYPSKNDALYAAERDFAAAACRFCYKFIGES